MQSFGYSFTENFFLLEKEEIYQISVSSSFIVYKKFVWKLMDLFVDSRLGEETECLVDNWGEINFEREFLKKITNSAFYWNTYDTYLHSKMDEKLDKNISRKCSLNGNALYEIISPNCK